MKQVVLVYQPYSEATLVEARRVAVHLERLGQPSLIHSAFELRDVPVGDVQLAVCFGGDGTVLRTARWLMEQRVPILPIRMGKLSFLGELDTSVLPAALEPYIDGDFWLDERSMLAATCQGQSLVALNDVVLARAETPRAVRINLHLDGADLGEYLSDGIIVSTATGSTAYSLAAGGPVLAPQMRNFVLTPIAPHLTPLRSIVAAEGSMVELVVASHQGAVLTIDGQEDLGLRHGDSVEVRTAEQTTVFARRGSRNRFYETLRSKINRGS